MDGFSTNLYMYCFFRDLFFDTIAVASYRIKTAGRKHTDFALYGKEPKRIKETDKKSDYGKIAHSNAYVFCYIVQCSTSNQFEIERLAFSTFV